MRISTCSTRIPAYGYLSITPPVSCHGEMCIRSGANQGCIKKRIVIANGLIWIPVHNNERQQDQGSSANRSQVTCTFERSPVFVSEQSDVGFQCPFIESRSLDTADSIK